LTQFGHLTLEMRKFSHFINFFVEFI